MKIAITGANGHLGMRLIDEIHQDHKVLALVRSESAARSVREVYADSVSCLVVDYADAKALAAATQGVNVLIHLVGIIKESRSNTFYQAHEATSQALVDMLALAGGGDQSPDETGLQKIIYLSLLGIDRNSTNPCLASRAMAEEILAAAPVSVSIIRVPMVLGEGDYASGALAKRVRKGTCFVLRGDSLEQPIYAGDVVNAMISRISHDQVETKPRRTPDCVMLDLAGEESLTRKELTLRAAAITGTHPRVVSVPMFLMMALAWVLEKTSSNPPVTRAMLGVLDHDDDVDIQPALSELGITLTSLDETLVKVLGRNDIKGTD